MTYEEEPAAFHAETLRILNEVDVEAFKRRLAENGDPKPSSNLVVRIAIHKLRVKSRDVSKEKRDESVGWLLKKGLLR